jgi:hypothetical protein
MNKFTVGQQLFVVQPSRYHPTKTFDVTITKVGTKYVSVEPNDLLYKVEYKFSKENLCENTAWLPAQAYLTRAVWEAKVSRDKAWEAFKRAYDPYRFISLAPDFLTLDEIEQMTELLTPYKAGEKA